LIYNLKRHALWRSKIKLNKNEELKSSAIEVLKYVDVVADVPS
jgi:hypothetical protein